MSRPSSLLVLALVWLVTASTLDAQSIEAGATLAASCKGSDGSFCNDSHSGLRTTGPYASVWLSDRIELGGRIVWLRQPDLHSAGLFIPPLEYTISDRRRTIVQAEGVWHFRRGKRVRPMFGIGAGAYRDRERVTCEPADCRGSVLGRLSPGESTASHRDISLVTGISALVHPRLRVRGGWRYHNPFKDELALSEWFVGAGYVLPLGTP